MILNLLTIAIAVISADSSNSLFHSGISSSLADLNDQGYIEESVTKTFIEPGTIKVVTEKTEKEHGGLLDHLNQKLKKILDTSYYAVIPGIGSFELQIPNLTKQKLEVDLNNILKSSMVVESPKVKDLVYGLKDFLTNPMAIPYNLNKKLAEIPQLLVGTPNKTNNQTFIIEDKEVETHQKALINSPETSTVKTIRDISEAIASMMSPMVNPTTTIDEIQLSIEELIIDHLYRIVSNALDDDYEEDFTSKPTISTREIILEPTPAIPYKARARKLQGITKQSGELLPLTDLSVLGTSIIDQALQIPIQLVSIPAASLIAKESLPSMITAIPNQIIDSIPNRIQTVLPALEFGLQNLKNLTQTVVGLPASLIPVITN